MDSAQDGGWRSIHLDNPPASCRTVGYLIQETKDHIALGHSLDLENDHVNGVMTIPRAAVTQMRRLRSRKQK